MKTKSCIRIIIIVVLSFVITNTYAHYPKSKKVKAEVYQRGHKHRPHYRYAKLPRWGYSYKTAPKHAVVISHKGARYHFHSGIFYKRKGKNYVIVKAPLGMQVKTLPKKCIHFQYKGRKYHYYYGTFYMKTKNTYTTVMPPTGARVDALPEGYSEVEIDGNVYYEFEGTLYKEVEMENKEVWYEVAGKVK